MTILCMVLLFILGCIIGYFGELKHNTEIFSRLAKEMTEQELIDWQKKMIAKSK